VSTENKASHPSDKPPSAFISYSWDDAAHREWVAALSNRLRFDGIDVKLDDWELRPGDQLPAFMESAIRNADFALIVCTPKYKAKSDGRLGGVGYEGNVITAELFVKGNERKFIPLLRVGDWRDAAPSWILGKYYIDLRGNPYDEEKYRELLSTLLEIRPVAPSVRAIGSEHLAPDAATRQQTYTDFVMAAIALLNACNKRFVVFKNQGAAAASLRGQVSSEIQKHSENLRRLQQEIYFFSSEPVKKAAGELFGWAFAGEIASMIPAGEEKFKEVHSKFSSAIPGFRSAIREEARLR
jgi:hypothetical protein